MVQELFLPVQKFFLPAQNNQGLELPVQGSSWGHDAWHFCVKTRGPPPCKPSKLPPPTPIKPPSPQPPPQFPLDWHSDSEHTNGALGRTPHQVLRCHNDQQLDHGPSVWRRWSYAQHNYVIQWYTGIMKNNTPICPNKHQSFLKQNLLLESKTVMCVCCNAMSVWPQQIHTNSNTVVILQA